MGLAGAAAGAQEGLQEYLTRRLVAAQQQQQEAARQASEERAARAMQIQEQQAADLHAQRTAPAPIKRTVVATIGPKGEPMQKAMTEDELSAGVPSYVAPPPVKEPTRRVITTIGPKGQPIQKSMTDDELSAGVPAYREPRAGADPETVGLRNDLLRLQVEAAKDKAGAATAAQDKSASDARTVTQGAVTQLERLKTHPGLNKAQGAYEMRGFTQDAQNFNAIRDQVVNALALPNLGALKGPMSDKDVAFVKNISTRLGNRNIDEAEAVKAIDEAIVFLQGKLTEGGTTNTANTAPAPQSGGFRVVGVR